MIILTDNVKAVLIDGLIMREKIKRHLLEGEPQLEYTTIRRANLEEFLERNYVP